MIHAFIFDYIGVLIHHRSLHMRGVVETVGADPTALKGLPELWQQAKVGAIPEDLYWNRLAEAVEMASGQALKARIYGARVVHTPVVDKARQLKTMGYKLAILSNALPSFDDEWAELGFVELFDIRINSSRVKLAKPDPRIYAMTCERLNVDPAHTVFIDDKQRNLDAAEGMHTILSRSPEQVVDDIDSCLTAFA